MTGGFVSWYKALILKTYFVVWCRSVILIGSLLFLHNMLSVRGLVVVLLGRVPVVSKDL